MICEPGDDEQHGSSVVCDVSALQALSRRVHLGKFVAESKFQVTPFYFWSSAGRGGEVTGRNEGDRQAFVSVLYVRRVC